MVLVLCQASAPETWKTRGETNLALEQHDQNPRWSPPSKDDPVDQKEWLNFRPPIWIHGREIFC